jgi:formylmethanofuran dehydrogenase subunit E-like metal-binding protein
MEYIECNNGIISAFTTSYKGPISIPDKCSDGSIIKTIDTGSGTSLKFTSIDMSGTHIEAILKNAFLSS